MSKKLSLVGVDLGGINTGVYFANLDPAGEDLKLTAPEGHVFRTTATGIQFSQAERTKFRHMRRNYKRRKLAKRLLRIIITTQLGVDPEKKMKETKNKPLGNSCQGC